MNDPAPAATKTLRSREVDPFAFFGTHASAVPGFGGEDASPDGRYCLHTPYVDVTPGAARFHLQMLEARATRGELTIRVHAFRAGENAEVGLAAGAKLRLDELEQATVDQSLRFTALEGLQYAVFAFFTEASDLTASSIKVTVEELDGPVPVRANLGTAAMSRFARADYATSHRLVAPVGPSLQLSLSQACTPDQLDYHGVGAALPELVAAEPDPLRQWEAAAAMRALDLAGVDAVGARGLIVDPPSLALTNELARHGIELDRLYLPAAPQDDAPAHDYGSERESEFDFVVSYAVAHAAPTAAGRLQAVGAGLRCLRGRGLGLFLMPFWTGTTHEPVPAAAANCLDRNAVQQIALRLIGQSYSVSQLAFPRIGSGAGSGGDITSFILIVHKLA